MPVGPPGQRTRPPTPEPEGSPEEPKISRLLTHMGPITNNIRSLFEEVVARPGAQNRTTEALEGRAHLPNTLELYIQALKKPLDLPAPQYWSLDRLNEQLIAEKENNPQFLEAFKAYTNDEKQNIFNHLLHAFKKQEPLVISELVIELVEAIMPDTSDISDSQLNWQRYACLLLNMDDASPKRQSLTQGLPCDFFQKTKAEQLDELLYSQNASLSPNQIKLYESLLIDIGAESRDFSYYAEELCKSYDKADKENDQNQLQSLVDMVKNLPHLIDSNDIMEPSDKNRALASVFNEIKQKVKLKTAYCQTLNYNQTLRLLQNLQPIGLHLARRRFLSQIPKGDDFIAGMHAHLQTLDSSTKELLFPAYINLLYNMPKESNKKQELLKELPNALFSLLPEKSSIYKIIDLIERHVPTERRYNFIELVKEHLSNEQKTKIIETIENDKTTLYGIEKITLLQVNNACITTTTPISSLEKYISTLLQEDLKFASDDLVKDLPTLIMTNTTMSTIEKLKLLGECARKLKNNQDKLALFSQTLKESDFLNEVKNAIRQENDLTKVTLILSSFIELLPSLTLSDTLMTTIHQSLEKLEKSWDKDPDLSALNILFLLNMPEESNIKYDLIQRLELPNSLLDNLEVLSVILDYSENVKYTLPNLLKDKLTVEQKDKLAQTAMNTDLDYHSENNPAMLEIYHECMTEDSDPKFFALYLSLYADKRSESQNLFSVRTRYDHPVIKKLKETLPRTMQLYHARILQDNDLDNMIAYLESLTKPTDAVVKEFMHHWKSCFSENATLEHIKEYLDTLYHLPPSPLFNELLEDLPRIIFLMQDTLNGVPSWLKSVAKDLANRQDCDKALSIFYNALEENPKFQELSENRCQAVTDLVTKKGLREDFLEEFSRLKYVALLEEKVVKIRIDKLVSKPATKWSPEDLKSANKLLTQKYKIPNFMLNMPKFQERNAKELHKHLDVLDREKIEKAQGHIAKLKKQKATANKKNQHTFDSQISAHEKRLEELSKKVDMIKVQFRAEHIISTPLKQAQEKLLAHSTFIQEHAKQTQYDRKYNDIMQLKTLLPESWYDSHKNLALFVLTEKHHPVNIVTANSVLQQLIKSLELKKPDIKSISYTQESVEARPLHVLSQFSTILASQPDPILRQLIEPSTQKSGLLIKSTLQLDSNLDEVSGLDYSGLSKSLVTHIFKNLKAKKERLQPQDYAVIGQFYALSMIKAPSELTTSDFLTDREFKALHAELNYIIESAKAPDPTKLKELEEGRFKLQAENLLEEQRDKKALAHYFKPSWTEEEIEEVKKYIDEEMSAEGLTKSQREAAWGQKEPTLRPRLKAFLEKRFENIKTIAYYINNKYTLSTGKPIAQLAQDPEALELQIQGKFDTEAIEITSDYREDCSDEKKWLDACIKDDTISKDDKREVLEYITGQRVSGPIELKKMVVWTGMRIDGFQAHTCFNQLEIPPKSWFESDENTDVSYDQNGFWVLLVKTAKQQNKQGLMFG